MYTKTSIDRFCTNRIVPILVGAFIGKSVYYRHGFSSVFFKRFFFDTPEVVKIVLLQMLYKILRDAKLYPLAQGTEPKKLPA